MIKINYAAKRHIDDIKKYVEVLLLILLTVGPFPPTVKIILYIVVFLMCIKHLGALQRIRPFYLVTICSMLIPMLLDIRNVDSSTPYSMAGFAYLAPFVFCLVYIREFEREEFYEKLEKVILFVTVTSIIGYLLVLFLPSVIERFPTVSFYGRSVKTIGIFGAIRNYTKVEFLHRNCGIAFEPGAFQFIPNLGLALLFRDKERKRDVIFWIRVIAYVVAVLTTYSSTGFVILAAILLVGTFSNRKHFLIMVVVIILLSSALVFSFNYQVDKMQTGNFGSRFENSLYVIQNYSKYIFGLGSTGYDSVYRLNPMIGSWDTFTNLYLRFGLAFTGIFIFMCTKLYKISLLVCITVVLTFMTESIVGPIIVMLFYYAVEQKYEQKSESNRLLRDRILCHERVSGD